MTSLTNSLPLVRGPSNQICFLLRKYMMEVHPWMIQIFGNAVYAYIKDDLASVQRPGIFIYPTTTHKDSFQSKYAGRIIFELHFSLKEQRWDLAENVIQIAEDIMLINLNQQFTEYLQQHMPGLFQFGKYAAIDYSKVYQKEAVVKMEFDFWVELIAYQNQLQSQGCDITSPDQQIYYPAKALLENIALIDSNGQIGPINGGNTGTLEVQTNAGISNLAVDPSDNNIVLQVQTI